MFEEIKATFAENDIALSDAQTAQFVLYHEALLSWNARADLISRNDEKRIVRRHFLQSAVLSKVTGNIDAHKVLDLGTGGGFPGVPLKIVMPGFHLILLDAKRWKTLFLRTLVDKLGLSDTEVVCARAETIRNTSPYQNQFDLVLSRAVTKLAPLWSLSQAFLKGNGKLICIKGTRVVDEIAACQGRHARLAVQRQLAPLTDPAAKTVQIVTCMKSPQ
jgi:16S rRNA (guanine527-N7)-methyltransferase